MPTSAEIRQFPVGPRVGMSGRALIKEIFRADSPEEYAQSLPAQSIYLALRATGLESAQDLLGVISDDQYKILLDLDFWNGDNFSDERFWQWLQALEHDGGFEDLARFIAVIDARLLGLMIARYVVVHYAEEPADLPPDKGFYTPDRGSTWLKLLLEDEDLTRRFGKLLALIFEENTTLFYQLLSEAGYVTTAELEEGAFLDRTRRLLDDGMPSTEASFRLNTPLTVEQLERLMEQDFNKSGTSARTVLPLAFSLYATEPFASFIGGLMDDYKDEIEAELALLSNAAIVFYQTDIAEPAEVSALIERVRGAINLGLERLTRSSKFAPRAVFDQFGLQKIYQLGLAELRELQRIAKRGGEEPDLDDAILAAIQRGASERFPVLPGFFQNDGSIEIKSNESPSAATKAFTHIVQVEAVAKYLRERVVQ